MTEVRLEPGTKVMLSRDLTLFFHSFAICTDSSAVVKQSYISAFKCAGGSLFLDDTETVTESKT